MNWNDAIYRDIIRIQSSCQLIIAGETKDGLPFCYEDSFVIQNLNKQQIVLTKQVAIVNPFEPLKQIEFVEISFRDRGVLYYGFVSLIQFDYKNNLFSLTLGVPETLKVFQNRQFNRISLPTSTPISCTIVGVRKEKTHAGTVFSGQMIDISGGGLSFVTTSRLFYPLFLELCFSLPKYPDKFVVQVEIIRVTYFSIDSYRIAVEFRNIPENTLNKLIEFCS
jgi:c-di-GMP-binding flagellar brake protein YcgR